MTQKNILTAVLAICLLCGGLAASWAVMQQRQANDTISRLLINMPVPPFIRPEFSNTDLTGRVSVVNFFASWCPPCEMEHPQLIRLKADHGIAIYGINYKDSDSGRQDYLQRLGNPYVAVTSDVNGTLSRLWDAAGVPETVIIDANGNIRYRLSAPLTPELVDRIIIPLIRNIQG
jgi:cytochrome c biogenesis protein CcmG/thiol:disulfide interchange protein DsbE